MNAPRRIHPLARAIALALALGTALPAAAQDVDLGNLGTRGFRVNGVDSYDGSGFSVSGAGDVNGDGLADLIVGAYRADPGSGSNVGESYVVFGKSDSATINLSSLGVGGFLMQGVDTDDRSGESVSGAGDVNGDGLTDLIIGSSGGDPGGDGNAGESFVVFGKTGFATVDLGNLGMFGFRIEGIRALDYSGAKVSGAGDVNGDGLADLIISAPGADPGGRSRAGESYVVFGGTDNKTLDLGKLGNDGFRIEGADAFDGLACVSGAGDVNGDGLADLIAGATGADPGGNPYAGESYVVFGKSDTATVNLGNLGDSGFRIDGIDAYDRSGCGVSSAGDINGDGFADILVGALEADPGGDLEAGESYVVFGKWDIGPVGLGDLGDGGFRIEGVDPYDNSGFGVSGAGDINGDGLSDLIVGAAFANPNGGVNAGESYVVFGKSSNTTVSLDNLGSGGFRLNGRSSGDRSGIGVSGAGDVNGDGLADLIVGAYTADGGAFRAGESYVVFSTSIPKPAATVRAHSRNGNAPRTAFGISGDGSNDSTPDARAWINFADGSAPVNLASLETMTLYRSAGAFPDSRASVHWQLQTTRQSWISAELRLRYLDSELTSGEQTLQVYFSSTGNAPFTGLPSMPNPLNNTISATITQPGYFFIGTAPDLIFADGFE